MLQNHWRVWGFAVGGVVLVGILLTWGWSRHASTDVRTSDTAGTDQEPGAPETPPLSAAKLYQAFAETAPSANETYTGRSLDVSGICERTTEGVSGGGSVYLIDTGARVRCDFAGARRSEVLGLRRGRGLMIRGVCRGASEGVVVLSNCRVMSDQPFDPSGPPPGRGFDFNR